MVLEMRLGGVGERLIWVMSVDMENISLVVSNGHV